MPHPLIALPLLLLAAPPVPAAELEVRIERVRSGKGVLHLCLTRSAAHFPDCSSDPDAVKRTVAAAQGGAVRFTGIPPGGWALSVFHDENRNEKLDTLVGIPREGFGFSRNPTIRFGAPKFRQVRVDLGPGITRQTVRMQYLL
ncbi:MAG: DUF2141 domain-containing protein [Allosphingosinicella sp.]